MRRNRRKRPDAGSTPVVVVVVVEPPPPVRNQRARHRIDDPIISMVGIVARPVGARSSRRVFERRKANDTHRIRTTCSRCNGRAYDDRSDCICGRGQRLSDVRTCRIRIRLSEGQRRDAAGHHQCSCSIDVIASLLPYDRYVTAETVLSMSQVRGNLGGPFRTSAQAASAVNDLRRAQPKQKSGASSVRSGFVAFRDVQERAHQGDGLGLGARVTSNSGIVDLPFVLEDVTCGILGLRPEMLRAI